MKGFARLFRELDQTTKTTKKVEALARYFDSASDEDKLWTVALFTHRRPSRTVKTSQLREWCAEVAQLPLWLFEESYHIVGDLAEAIALLLPKQTSQSDLTLSTRIQQIIDLKPKEDEEKKTVILQAWSEMNSTERFLFNKIITGGFRIGVSQKLMVKALSKHTGEDENNMAHRLMGNWTPQTTTWTKLILESDESESRSRPYPFYLAYALDIPFEDLGSPEEWSAEWKWDGIRGQIIKRNGELYIWSRGEELVTDKFPELQVLLELEADNFVLDGEILPYKDGRPLGFNQLQTRIGRKNIAKKHLVDTPISIMAYDLLEYEGEDIRHLPFDERRKKLDQLYLTIGSCERLELSSAVAFTSWEKLADIRATSREHHAEGLMLKRKDSPYKVGRKKGDWWKWKVDPLTIDAVMIYAQRGHGRRANLYTDFTFAVQDSDRLVPFAKAYSGLTDVEFKEVTQFVKKNTVERFGPVSSVKPELVFELAFEGIAKSTRHKSGVALRFPRIKRWRKDKPASEINSLEDLMGVLEQYGS